MPDQGAQQPNQKRVDELKRQIEKGRADGKDVSEMEQELQKLQDAQRQTGQQGGQQSEPQRR